MIRVMTLLLAVAVNAAAQTPAAAPKADGAKIFAAKCTACHAKDGKGSLPMAKMFKLKDPAVLNLTLSKESDAELVKTITDGREKMPSFKGKLKDAEFSALIAYIRTLSAAPAAPKTPAPSK